MGFAVAGGQLYVFGGFDGVDNTDDFHRFSPTTRMWNQLSTSGINQPLKRVSFVFVGKPDGTIYLFGGDSSDGSLADFYNFSSTWSEVDSVGSPPSPRSSTGFTLTPSGELYVFGGIGVTPDQIGSFYRFKPDLELEKNCSQGYYSTGSRRL
mmetsp:Transcript_28515/g.59616  ORF Transcript_28515/g.59616 Transcript_28515/m.59616 type:complete len:152 (-) Transcript_28515:1077-1532(-)|eukprot:CAMPEP_0172154452 /NCGR_PEP_ID=MMETSP1050-20130122/2043_1 /TAXON_ID=233186 /ORGANISM="Cryptomonas curvata, Strain CCAP979/52" /LENGTH=151 /DNA_ID=CAMNT_0012823171 /DNA_START=392 /DNA_END=847 /DNA_ORIENTATION=-